jgi:membrane protein YdbS with pleckstrin-like domain
MTKQQETIIIRASPFVFLFRVAIIEFFFALGPLALVILLNLRSEYEVWVFSRTVSYTLFVTIAITTLQVLIIAIAFVTWYVPVYHVDDQQIKRRSLFGERKLLGTQSISHTEQQQGPIARRFNYGTLILHNSNGPGKAEVKNIPDPGYYAELIQHLVQPAPRLPSLFEPKPTRELIAGGENQHAEFKSSLMWDYRRQHPNKDLYEPVMKNIAAFMNTRGGVVLIGVGDNGEILGLGPDLNTLRKPNVDGFENVFNMAFNKMIGAEFRQYVDVTFPEIDEEVICLVTVRPSSEPAYLVHKGTEKFYIRAGNASQPLPVSKATKYIQSHFV